MRYSLAQILPKIWKIFSNNIFQAFDIDIFQFDKHIFKKIYTIINFLWQVFQTLRNPFCSNITQFIIFSLQIIFKYPLQSVCGLSNPFNHFKRPKIQKNPFCSLPPSFLLLKYYPSLSTLITLYWIQLLKSNKNQNKIQLIINQFQFIHCWYSDCSDLQSNSKKICQKCSIWDSKKNPSL